MRKVRLAYLWLAKSGSVGSGNTNHIRHWLNGIPKDKYKPLLVTPFLEVSRLENYFGGHTGLSIIQKKDLWTNNFWSASKILKRCLEENDVDLLHTLGPRADIIGGLAKKNGLRIPVISTVEVYIPGCNPPWWKHQIYKRLYSGSSKYIDAITAISNQTRNELVNEFGVSEEKVSVINSGVDISQYPLKSGWPFGKPGEYFPVIGYIGRLSPEKRIDLLLESFAQLLGAIPEANLCIAGDGNQKALLMEYAKNLGIKERIKFLGWLTNPLDFYNMIDIFVMTSASEGLPWTILEAAALGIPIVSTNSGGIYDVIKQGETGFLLDDMEPEHIAEAIISLLRNNSLARKMASSARDRIESHFNHAREMKDFLNLYEKFVGAL